MPNPPVAEKTLIDIDVSKGLNEALAEENVDWTKGLTRLENLVSDGGNLVVRPGLQSIQTNAEGAAIRPLNRLAALPDGVGVVGKDFNFYHLQESSNLSGGLINKGRMPEFSVTSETIAGENSSTSTNTTHPIGTYQILATDGGGAQFRYKVTCYVNFSTGTPASMICIDVMDLYGGNMIRRYKTEVGALTNAVTTLCGETLFIFIQRSGVVVQYITLDFFDDSTLPANLNDGFHDFIGATASGATGDTLVGAVSTSSNAYMLLSGTTCRVAKYNSDGTYSTEQALSAFSEVGGIDTDGTSIFIAGVAAGIEGMSWTLWQRATYSGMPWAGTASAGSSGSKSITSGGATRDPGTGVTLNGLTVADYDGTNDFSVVSANPFTAGSGTIVCLFNIDATAATTGQGYSDENFIVTDSGFLGMSFSSSGVRGHLFDGAFKSVTIACGTGGWHLAIMRWDSTNLKIRLDSSGDTSVAAGAGGVGTNWFNGRDYNLAGRYMNGKIAELLVSGSAITDPECASVKAYMNARYGLAL